MQYTLKKSLGQHFLKDENICRRIVEELQTHPFTQLLEVGPGGGALTKYLLKIENINLKAVELDTEKVHFLEQTYPALTEKILNEDFLEMNTPFEGEFIVIGNFPYNISTQILFKMLDWKEQVPVMIGMFQKEVAERAASPSGSKVYGVLSVLIQAFFKVEYLFDVDAECFTPPPKVTSGVIRLTRREDVLPMKSTRSFFVLVKTAFNQRRKTLRNAVKSLFDETVLAEDLFNKRAEVLNVEDFAALTFRMK
ncbi:MAG TPA: 16S rRNA (adenine(1518)-N(6)/adenine(1519)-N(6))-dimethyltransferase RsmA [Segetibacter sp.]|jgi:16S rRNA (adenine1518-N6/adenine1519-N6)-dimethyltransferase